MTVCAWDPTIYIHSASLSRSEVQQAQSCVPHKSAYKYRRVRFPGQTWPRNGFGQALQHCILGSAHLQLRPQSQGLRAGVRQRTLHVPCRRQPLFNSTAVQLGIIRTDGLPNLLDYVVPAKATTSSMAREYLNRLLMKPPPTTVAHANRRACKKLRGTFLPNAISHIQSAIATSLPPLEAVRDQPIAPRAPCAASSLSSNLFGSKPVAAVASIRMERTPGAGLLG